MSEKERKLTKGILGVRKSAQNQVLMFGRYSDPLPSDDSDDSDYEPITEDVLPIIAEKNNKKNTKNRIDSDSLTTRKEGKNSCHPRKGKGQSPTLPESTSVGDYSKKRKTISAVVLKFNSVSNAWSDLIPSEVLLQIFIYCVETQGALPVLSRLSRVCRRWNLLAKEPKLYRKTDLSCVGKYSIATDGLIKRFVTRGMSGAVDLTLDGWIKLSDKGVEVLVKNCKNLKSISLSCCEGVSPMVLSIMADYCTKLTSIDMSGTKINHNSLKKFLSQHGYQLNEILLRNCKGFPGSTILPMIQEFCPNLLHLDISSTPVRQIKIEQLQEKCPKLQNLQLANLVLQPINSRNAKMGPLNGFSDLQQLSLACGFQGSLSVNDTLINRLLKTSCFLRVLDMRGCTHVSQNAIQGLCATSLENLYIGNMDAKQPLVEVILNKWHASLHHLDLSYNPAIRDSALSLFDQILVPNLTSLDLTSTGVSITGVRYVVNGCPKLQDLNLTSCRGIPRGLKQRHKDERFAHLAKQISGGSLDVDSDMD